MHCAVPSLFTLHVALVAQPPLLTEQSAAVCYKGRKWTWEEHANGRFTIVICFSYVIEVLPQAVALHSRVSAVAGQRRVRLCKPCPPPHFWKTHAVHADHASREQLTCEVSGRVSGRKTHHYTNSVGANTHVRRREKFKNCQGPYHQTRRWSWWPGSR